MSLTNQLNHAIDESTQTQNISEAIAITYKKGSNNEKKWLRAVQSRYSDKLGKYMRESSTTLHGTTYYIHVFEKGAFLMTPQGNKTALITHFGFGDFKNTNRMKWSSESKTLQGDVLSAKGHMLAPVGVARSVKDVLGRPAKHITPKGLIRFDDGLYPVIKATFKVSAAKIGELLGEEVQASQAQNRIDLRTVNKDEINIAVLRPQPTSKGALNQASKLVDKFNKLNINQKYAVDNMLSRPRARAVDVSPTKFLYHNLPMRDFDQLDTVRTKMVSDLVKMLREEGMVASDYTGVAGYNTLQWLFTGSKETMRTRQDWAEVQSKHMNDQQGADFVMEINVNSMRRDKENLLTWRASEGMPSKAAIKTAIDIIVDAFQPVSGKTKVVSHAKDIASATGDVKSALANSRESGSWSERPIVELSSEKGEIEVRHWGNWNSDNDGDEDDDWENLSDQSSAALEKLLNEIESKYPKLDIDWQTGEKNWIYVDITGKE